MTIPVPDFNPPNLKLNASLLFAAIDPLPVAKTVYVVEQFKDVKTGKIWYSNRATKNASDGVIPTVDNTLLTAIKNDGIGNFVRTQIGVFSNQDDAIARISNIKNAIGQIGIFSNSTVSTPPTVVGDSNPPSFLYSNGTTKLDILQYHVAPPKFYSGTAL